MDSLRDAWLSFEAALPPKLATMETEVLVAVAIGALLVLAGRLFRYTFYFVNYILHK